MNELQAQLTDVQTQLTAEKAKGAEKNTDLISQLEQQEADILAKMDEASKKQAVEDKVAETHQQVVQSFESIVVGDQTITLRELAVNEQGYQILSIYFTQYVTNQATQNEKDKQALQASYESQITELKTTVDSERTQRQTIQTELTDMTAKRDAAAAELDEAKQEIDRLNSQVNDLRTEIAVGAKAAVTVTETNLGANLGDLVKEYNASKPGIYDIEPMDNLRRQYKAKLMDTGEEITFNYLDKGKYREVTADEAERFQAEQAANASQTSDIPNPTLDIAPPAPPTVGGEETSDSFPPQVPNDNNANGLDVPNPDGEVAPETVTRAEFEELKGKVETLANMIANPGAAA